VLVMAVGAPVTALFMLAPHAITNALMGNAYTEFGAMLPRLAVAVFIISVLNVVVSYYLALRQYRALPALIVGAGVTYLLLLINHANINAIVNDVLIGSLVMLGALGFWTIMPKARGAV
jgi:hypothetical protein